MAGRVLSVGAYVSAGDGGKLELCRTYSLVASACPPTSLTLRYQAGTGTRDLFRLLIAGAVSGP